MKELSVTKRQSIRDCKKIWKPVAEGKAKTKEEALSLMPDLKIKYSDYYSCPLCAYVIAKSGDIRYEDCSLYCSYYLTYEKYCEDYPSYDDNPVLFAQHIMKLKE